MRYLLLAAAVSALAACQPEPAPAPEEAPATVEAEAPPEETAPQTSFAITDTAEGVTLSVDEGTPDLLMSLSCKVAGPSLVLTGATAQVALGNMAAPYGISLSGETFPADLVPGDEAAPQFSVTTPLTPEALKALSTAITARIMVSDNYAFVESGVDTAENFETFAAACAAKTRVTPAP